ncbi:hypothetical protein LZC95_20760 [Pendulispora brunnea]|uniref:Uncharacterized protein n=1 Tax=Pendulispora brunnea TaxID=2905690 RepID=A0ABZ2KKQ8_9BACT
MRTAIVFLSALALGVGGCSSEPERPEPLFVRVALVGATVGPAKFDGTRWDALTVLPNLVAGVTREAGGETGTAIIAAHMTGEVLAPFEKPDPAGWAELTGVRRPLTGCGSDTLTPAWSSAEWRHVRLSDATRLRVHLVDRDDIGSDEPIGDVDVHAGYLREALEKGIVVQVPVSDQTHGQLLFVGVSVAPEA